MSKKVKQWLTSAGIHFEVVAVGGVHQLDFALTVGPLLPLLRAFTEGVRLVELALLFCCC